MGTIASRIIEFINAKKLSIRQFEDLSGLANGAIASALKADEAFFAGKKDKPGGISSHNIAKILQAFPDISPDWLMIAKGDMLRQHQDYRKTTESDLELINNKLDEIIRKLE